MSNANFKNIVAFGTGSAFTPSVIDNSRGVVPPSINPVVYSAIIPAATTFLTVIALGVVPPGCRSIIASYASTNVDTGAATTTFQLRVATTGISAASTSAVYFSPGVTGTTPVAVSPGDVVDILVGVADTVTAGNVNATVTFFCA